MGTDVHECFHYPVKVVDGVKIFPAANPPRRGHDEGEESMRSGGVESIPVVVLGVTVGVRPCFSGSPLWLAFTPPSDPSLVEFVHIGDGGDGVAFTLPVSDFRWAGMEEPSYTLDCGL